MAEQEINVIELVDIPVRRLLNQQHIWTISMMCYPREDQMYRYVGDYTPLQPRNWSYARIPALIHLSTNQAQADQAEAQIDAGVQPNRIIEFFKNTFTKQLGAHIYVNYTQLEVVYSRLRPYIGTTCPPIDNPHESRYVCHSKGSNRVVNCVYPILMDDEQRPGTLCLGIHVRRLTGNSDRMFIQQRIPNTECRSLGVNNLTEESLFGHFVRSRADDTFSCLSNGMQNEQCFAIYVGAGAKLLVVDTLIQLRTGNRGDVTTVSLFQQGSIIIVEGNLHLVYRALDVRGNYMITTLTNIRDDPDNLTIPNNIKERLRGWDNIKCVIFLGADDTHIPRNSKVNTICWQLKVDRDRGSGQPTGHLFLPECGRVLAIECWRDGFSEMYYRHIYEKLYQSVLLLGDRNGQGMAQYSTLPSWGLPPDIYQSIIILRDRQFILEMRQNFNRNNVPQNSIAWYIPYEDRDEIEQHLNDIHLETLLMRINDLPNIPGPPVPSAIPPIREASGRYWNVDPRLELIRDANDRHIYWIEDKRYSQHMEVHDAYEWKYYMKLFDLEQGNGVWAGNRMRCGYDYIIYQTDPRFRPIGRAICWYLQEVDGQEVEQQVPPLPAQPQPPEDGDDPDIEIITLD